MARSISRARPPRALQHRIKELPERPGVYLFKDAFGAPIYIGKAVSIRKRVQGHFRRYSEHLSKEGVMLRQVRDIAVIETATEADALLLEASLVRERLPKYNKELRDDKSYPFLKITAEEYPRLLVARGRKADGARYFGPYTSARLLRDAVPMLRKQFPMRTCRTMPKRVCLQYHLGQCGGSCEGIESRERYRTTVKELENFLDGRREAMVRTLARRMREFSERREYEKAMAAYHQMRALALLSEAPKAADPKTALDDLQKAMDLDAAPRRIEGYDISNIAGREAVGSMVVFTDGTPDRGEYRRFRIQTVGGIDDYRMMQEMLRRRFSRALSERQALPDLVVIDGGKGHLGAALSVLGELGLTSLSVISIAKEHEHLFRPGRAEPMIFPQNAPLLELIRRLRDEAHRFAILYHRRLHRKEALLSELDAVPGIGPKTRERLLNRLGSLERIRRASEEELVKKGGLNAPLARRLREWADKE